LQELRDELNNEKRFLTNEKENSKRLKAERAELILKNEDL
jgi:hypothetical protein